jgi:hypothetical protein
MLSVNTYKRTSKGLKDRGPIVKADDPNTITTRKKRLGYVIRAMRPRLDCQRAQSPRSFRWTEIKGLSSYLSQPTPD